MKAKVTKEFTGMDGEKARSFKVGDRIYGDPARWAVDNGCGVEVEDDDKGGDAGGAAKKDAPVSASASTSREGDKAAAPRPGKSGKGRAPREAPPADEGAGDAGGEGGQGEDD